jgi:DNA-binding transcriptional ArsR family regulator
MALTKTFNALADPTRHSILEYLKKKDMTAGEIGSKFTISGPSISHHLQVLKQADLISSRRQGQEIIYSLNVSTFEEVADALINFFKNKK